MFIAGIDGGGTHTRIEMRDMDNCLVRRGDFGPFNINSIGETAFRGLLREVFAWCGGMENCARLCVGAAGISNPKVGEILGEELAQAGFSGQWKLCGDQEIALRGAMDGPGVVIISGTGSICALIASLMNSESDCASARPTSTPSFATPKSSLPPCVLANALTLLSQLVGSLRSSISFLS